MITQNDLRASIEDLFDSNFNFFQTYHTIPMCLRKNLQKKQYVFQWYKDGVKRLKSIECQYIKSDLDKKGKLIGSIFPENFQFENKKVRSADINPVLLKIATVNKGFKGNKKRDKSKKVDLSREVLKAGLEPARP